MKEGIHPEYKTAVVKCACGETLKHVLQEKKSMLKFARNVILSIPENRSWLTPADVLKSSERDLVWTNNVLFFKTNIVFFIIKKRFKGNWQKSSLPIFFNFITFLSQKCIIITLGKMQTWF